MQFLDTLPFAKADPGQEARVSTLWQARSQRKNPEMERSGQESQKVIISTRYFTDNDVMTANTQLV